MKPGHPGVYTRGQRSTRGRTHGDKVHPEGVQLGGEGGEVRVHAEVSTRGLKFKWGHKFTGSRMGQRRGQVGGGVHRVELGHSLYTEEGRGVREVVRVLYAERGSYLVDAFFHMRKKFNRGRSDGGEVHTTAFR